MLQASFLQQTVGLTQEDIVVSLGVTGIQCFLKSDSSVIIYLFLKKTSQYNYVVSNAPVTEVHASYTTHKT